MKKYIQATIVGVIMLTSALAYADVARTVAADGDTRTAAMAAAKASATASYGDRITSWGESNCSSKTIHPDQYDQTVTATVWTCQVDFTTSK
jgi:hypothetical protein